MARFMSVYSPLPRCKVMVNRRRYNGRAPIMRLNRTNKKYIYMRSVYLSTTSKTLDLWLPFAKATKIDTLRENTKIIFILLA